MKIIGIFMNFRVKTGGNRRYLELLELLASRGHEVYVLLNEYLDYTPKYFIPIRFCVPKVSLPLSLRILYTVKHNFASIYNAVFDADYIHIHGELHYFAAKFLLKRLKVPLFFAYRSNTVRRAFVDLKLGKNPFDFLKAIVSIVKYSRMERLIAKTAKILTFQDDFDRNDFLRRVRKTNAQLVIIPGNISDPRFKKETEGINHSKKLKRLVYVGTLGEGKGIIYLLRALAELKERGIMLPLDVLGRGVDLTHLQKVCTSFGIDTYVTFHGYVTDPFSFLAFNDLMVFPSLVDSFPDSVLEALHVGIPVIASNVGGIPDILKYEALMFPPFSSMRIVDIIEQCVISPNHYSEIRKLCSERRELFHFDWAGKFEDAMKTGMVQSL